MKGTAVIIVDMQDFFLKNLDVHVRSTLIKNQIHAIDSFMKSGTPIILVEYKAGGVLRGPTTASLRSRLGAYPLATLIKESNSGFTKTGLEDLLKKARVRKIALMGINANACIQDTAIGALRRGYEVIVTKGLVANSYRKDLELSSRNERWFRNNCIWVE